MKPKLLVLPLVLVSLVGASGCGDDDSGNESSAAKKGLLASDPQLKKVAAASARNHGLKGRNGAKLKEGSAASLKPGDPLDTTGFEQGVQRYLKEEVTLEARVECPPTIQYAPGAVFYCKLYLPNGSSLDIKCTQTDKVENGSVQIDWEIVNSQPVPKPSEGGETAELKDAASSAKRFEAPGQGPPKPGERINISDLDEFIERQIKEGGGPDVNVECPDEVVWSPGSTFFCKLYLPSGAVYDIKCTMLPNGQIHPELVTKP